MLKPMGLGGREAKVTTPQIDVSAVADRLVEGLVRVDPLLATEWGAVNQRFLERLLA